MIDSEFGVLVCFSLKQRSVRIQTLGQSLLHQDESSRSGIAEMSWGRGKPTRTLIRAGRREFSTQVVILIGEGIRVMDYRLIIKRFCSDRGDARRKGCHREETKGRKKSSANFFLGAWSLGSENSCQRYATAQVFFTLVLYCPNPKRSLIFIMIAQTFTGKHTV